MRMNTRWNAAVAVAALLLASCSGGGSSDTSPDGSGATPEAPDSSFEDSALGQLAAAKQSGEHTELALTLTEFTWHFGDVDGALPIEPDDSVSDSATGIAEDLFVLRDELSDEQVASVRAAFRPVVEMIDPEAFSRVRTAPTTAEEDQVRRWATDAAATIRSQLGGPALEFSIEFWPVDPPEGNSTTTATVLVPGLLGGLWEWLTDSAPDDPRGELNECSIIVGPSTMAYTDAAARHSGIAHEMFHCWSIYNAPTIDAHIRIPDWFDEGVASWVGENIAGGSEYSENWWKGYFEPKNYDLFSSSYVAMPFWAWLAERKGDLWSDIVRIHRTAVGGSNAATLSAALDGIDVETLSSQAASRLRESGWGAAWDMHAPGIQGRHEGDTTSIVQDRRFAVVAGPGQLRNVAIRAIEDLTPAEAGQVLGVTMIASGPTRIRWNDGAELGADDVNRSWCVADSCACPDGSTATGYDDVPPGRGDIHVAATGPPGGEARVEITVTDICADDAERGEESGILVGTWIATNPAVTTLFEGLFAGTEATFDGLAYKGEGQVVLTFRDDGTANLTYDDVGLIAPGEFPVEMVVDGGGDLRYRVEGDVIRFEGQSLDIGISVFGQALDLTGADVTLGAPSEAIWSTEISGGTELLLSSTSASTLIPRNWTKQD